MNLGLAARVEHVTDPRCEEIFPRHFPSIVRVRTRDGSELVEEVLANRGTRERPLSEAEVRLKYDLNARALGSDADELAERIGAVGRLGDVRGLLSL